MKYYNMPGGMQTIEEAYGDNEARQGGHYPIGSNKSWHSGMHINTNSDIAIRPVISGEMAAYRINYDYQTIPLDKEISSKAHSKLNIYTARLYQYKVDRNKFVLWKEKLTKEEESELKEELTSDEYNALPEDMKFFYEGRKLIIEVKELYVLDSGETKYIPVKKIATNFILLKHEVSLPPSTEEKIRFYTIYMGIMPGVPDALKKYLNKNEDFQNDSRRVLSEQLPFYQKWYFILTMSNARHRYYETEKSKKKLIKGSLCSFSDGDGSNLKCKFDNVENEEIEMTADRIDIKSSQNQMQYRPKEDRAPVYKVLDRQRPPFVIAELRKTDEVCFYDYIKEFGNEHFEVMINPEEVYRDLTPGNAYTWWCKGVRREQGGTIPYEAPLSVFYKNNDADSIRRFYKVVDFSNFLRMRPDGIEWEPQLCGAIKYDPEKIEMEFLFGNEVVSVKKKNSNSGRASEYKSEILIPPHPHPVVIIKNPVCRGIISFLFYDDFRRVNVGCYEPMTESGTYARSDTYSTLAESRKTNGIVRKLTVNHILPFEGLAKGEKLDLDVLVREIDSLPEEFIRNENLRQCRLWCREKGYKVLVKRADLKTGEARGALNEKIDGSWTDGGKLTVGSMEGVVIYDGPAEGSNARDIMPVSEEKFEITHPASLYRENERCEITYKDGTKKYASFKGCGLKGGVFFESGYGYKDDQTESDNRIKIVKEPRQITRNEILGYPNAHHRLSNVLFYDLACFFTDKMFLNSNTNNEAGKRYIIQSGTELYGLVENTEGENTNEFRLLTGEERPETGGYCRKTGEAINKDGKKHIELRTNTGAKYYVPLGPDGKPNGMEEVDLLNWKEYFIVEESDNDGDLFCDSAEEILRAVAAEDTQIDVDRLFEKDYKGRITGEEFLKSYRNNNTAYKAVALGLRKLVCGHPLEWDAELYKEEKFRKPPLLMSPQRFEKLKKEMELLDIWKGGGEEGIKEAVGNHDSNNFWFAHPVYFINHLDKAGLLAEQKRVQDLIMAQDEVMDMDCLKQGARGMYGDANGGAFCNHAVYLTIKAVDKKYKKFIGNSNLYKGDEPPWDYKLLEENFKKGLREYTHRSNVWCDILEKQAGDGASGICELFGEDTQGIANQGYVVIGAKKNEDDHPHYVTVRPNKGYTETDGPTVAHVGAHPNEERKAKAAFVSLTGVHWYYNRNQEFTNSFEFVFRKSSNGHTMVDVNVT